MKSRVFALILVLGLLGWLALVVIQSQFALGRFAESPQRFLLQPGRRVIVGGGRAVMGYVTLRKKREVLLELKCAEQTVRLELTESQESEEVCGVKVRWLGRAGRHEALRDSARFEVSWD